MVVSNYLQKECELGVSVGHVALLAIGYIHQYHDDQSAMIEKQSSIMVL